MLSNIMARLIRALDRSYCDLGNHLPQDLSPKEKTKIQKLLKKLTRDPSDQQLLSPKQLHALRIALDDFTTTLQPSDKNIALLNILKTGETTDHFNDEERKEANRAYLSAIEVIKEICDPDDIRIYCFAILLRLGYASHGFCTIYSSIRNVLDRSGRNKDSSPYLAIQITAGILNGISNLVFTGQLLKLLKSTLPKIKYCGLNYYTLGRICYGLVGIIAMLPSVVQILHTEKNIVPELRYTIATIIFGTLLLLYTEDCIKFHTEWLKPGYQALQTEELRQKTYNYIKTNKLETGLVTIAYILGAGHSLNYILGELDFFKPPMPAAITLAAVTGAARIPFIAVVIHNAKNAIKNRDHSDHCSAPSLLIACGIAVSCICSSLVTFAQSGLDLNSLSILLMMATLVFGFLKSVKNYLTTNQVPLDSVSKLFRELETSDAIELGNMRTNIQTQETNHLTGQITRHLSLDLPRREQPKSSPRQPHEARSERRHSAGW